MLNKSIMRYRTIKPRIKIIYALCILFLLGISSTNAQPEFKRKLDAYNQRDFPTGQLADYVNCVNKLETYYIEFISSEQKNKDKIAELKTAINQNKNLLAQAKLARDSIGIGNYTKKEIDLNKELETLNNSVPNSGEKASCKSTLIDSYKKLKEYYFKIDDPKEKDYKTKLDALNASN